MPDASEQLLATYEKLYYFELDRKEKLFARFPILLAFYSILLGTLASYLSNLPSGSLYLLVIFYSAAAGQIIFILWSAYYTHRFLYCDEYEYLLPDSSEEEPAAQENEPAEPDAEGEDIVESLIGKYRSSVLWNFELNKSRNADFFKATNRIILALVFAFIGGFPYFTLRERPAGSMQHITIDSLVKVKVMPDTTITQKPQKPGSEPSRPIERINDAKRDATGLGVYRLRDRHTSAESKKQGEWVRRK